MRIAYQTGHHRGGDASYASYRGLSSTRLEQQSTSFSVIVLAPTINIYQVMTYPGLLTRRRSVYAMTGVALIVLLVAGIAAYYMMIPPGQAQGSPNPQDSSAIASNF